MEMIGTISDITDTPGRGDVPRQRMSRCRYVENRVEFAGRDEASRKNCNDSF